MGLEEELLRIAKKLEKMVARKKMTTRIGVAVNGVRKHCSDKEVVSLAKVLIKNWKQLLDSPRTAKGEREERDKAKKKEKGLGCSDWKPDAGPSPPRKKGGGEPQTRSNSGRSKAETPKTPSSPTTPTFAPSVCLLAPCYLTGDSVRDKCVEMLSAALKVEDDFKDYGVNCDKLASEIEDHILLSYGARAA
ncbi:Transcription elongation factor A protein 3 [Microtus ochrogaster]|uniref:Transcription elongation factor A protein 3 n=1 Tax=Microtus ochrogaster TaxID=79684 RepID=A0A8J6KMU6_MICOH|nr:Transcription elongation factor A protein 3 [Microtus ochrogaster]